MGVPIRRAGEDDRKAVIRLLDEGFSRDPVSNWIFPTEEYRRSTHPALMGAFLDMALSDGYVDLNEDGSAVALWLTMPAGGHSDDAHAAGGDGAADPSDDPDSPDDAVQFREAVDPANERVEQIARLTAAAHPVERSHDYLMLIAVTPALHGKGLGSALLAHALDRFDIEGRPAYLEASSSRSRSLYLRHGFTALPQTVHLPDGPLMYPMWRDPQKR